jgi:predicted ATPase/DNA-binding CsgD family transcriptional regulator
MATVSTNLPEPLTRFVGREAELSEAAALLGEARLLTLTGPGGAGKTRLALRLASAVAEDFPDRVWFVDLSSVSDGEFVLDRVALSLHVKEPGRGKTLGEAVGRYLARRQALLVLDNCEHVVESAAVVTAGLLAAAPAVKIVATSREPLGVGGEVTWAVPPLSEADGVELFSDRARGARPQFRLRVEDADAVRFICRRLDGLPLAIELAAARARALAPARIAAHLQDHFRMLSSGPRTAPGRQATLRASFEWSYELLTKAERALLRQLSVFAGGFELEAALSVCPAASVELLAALADRSLITVDDRSGGAEPRYRMLETIREFAAERLAEAGEVDLVHGRHRDHYLALAEAAEPKLLSPEEDRWRTRLGSEQDNLRAALAWSREQGDVEALARMLPAMYAFWALQGRVTEFQIWVGATLERAGDLSPGLRARILLFECVISVMSGRSLGEVPAMANEALALARAGGDRREEALALLMLGMVAGLLGGAEAMRPYFDEGLPLARSTGFALVELFWLTMFATLRWFQSDPGETRRRAEEAIEVSRTLDRHHRLDGLAWAGMTALFQGRLADAARLLETVVADGRETTDPNYLSSLPLLALVAMFRGDFAAARAGIADSLAAWQAWEAEGREAMGFDRFSRFVLGWMQLAGGEAAHAVDSLTPIADALRSFFLPRWAALPLVLMAEARLALGALDEAEANLDEATSLARAGKLTWLLGRAGRVRAKLRVREGNLEEAESLVQEALGLAREAGDQLGLVDALELLARLAADQDSNKEAVRLWAAADSSRSALGYVRFPVEQGPYDAAIAGAKEALGPDEFAAVWVEGAKLSPDEAIAYAARGRGERKRPATGWASLTPAELEVVRLVGQHLSNPDIAARLFVSRATVKTHLVHIFSKLNIDSRSELAAEAVKRDMQAQSGRRT